MSGRGTALTALTQAPRLTVHERVSPCGIHEYFPRKSEDEDRCPHCATLNEEIERASDPDEEWESMRSIDDHVEDYVVASEDNYPRYHVRNAEFGRDGMKWKRLGEDS